LVSVWRIVALIDRVLVNRSAAVMDVDTRVWTLYQLAKVTTY